MSKMQLTVQYQEPETHTGSCEWKQALTDTPIVGDGSDKPPRDLPPAPPRRTPGDSDYARSKEAQGKREALRRAREKTEQADTARTSEPPE